MARIRTIKPKFWDDIKLGKVSRDARLTYIGLWNFSDDLGVVLADLNWIKAKLFPYDDLLLDDLKTWLQELVQNGFLKLIKHEFILYYHIPKLLDHQVINRPNLQDIFILEPILRSILYQSVTNHGLITDQSLNENYIKDKIEVQPNNTLNNNDITSNHGSINDQSLNDQCWRGVGEEEERKGKESKGSKKREEREKKAPADFFLENQIFDIEEELLKNQMYFEKILMKTGWENNEQTKIVLRKYHLYMQEKEFYPKSRKALYAGFEKWLLNEKKINPNGSHQQTSDLRAKKGISETATEAYRKFTVPRGRKNDTGV